MLLRPARIELQVEHHFCNMALSSMIRVASWIIGETRKEGFVLGTVIIVWRRLAWGILHAVHQRFHEEVR